VWVEAWDVTYSAPYYVNFRSGETQWQYPEGDDAYVVQHGSEDSEWYWQWLSQGTSAAAVASSSSETDATSKVETAAGSGAAAATTA
jgi:hypothetical protein